MLSGTTSRIFAIARSLAQVCGHDWGNPIQFLWLQVHRVHLETNQVLILYLTHPMSCLLLTRRHLRLTCLQNSFIRVGESSGQGAKIGLTFSTECLGIHCGRCLPSMPTPIMGRTLPHLEDLQEPAEDQEAQQLTSSSSRHHTSTIQSMTLWESTTDLTSLIITQ